MPLGRADVRLRDLRSFYCGSIAVSRIEGPLTGLPELTHHARFFHALRAA
jgi:hypothetical protein